MGALAATSLPAIAVIVVGAGVTALTAYGISVATDYGKSKWAN